MAGVPPGGAAPPTPPPPPRLRLLNLRTGHESGTVTVRLPRGQQIDDLDFDAAGRVVVRSRTKTGVAIYRVSRTTGKATLLRTLGPVSKSAVGCGSV